MRALQHFPCRLAPDRQHRPSAIATPRSLRASRKVGHATSSCWLRGRTPRPSPGRNPVWFRLPRRPACRPMPRRASAAESVSGRPVSRTTVEDLGGAQQRASRINTTGDDDAVPDHRRRRCRPGLQHTAATPPTAADDPPNLVGCNLVGSRGSPAAEHHRVSYPTSPPSHAGPGLAVVAALPVVDDGVVALVARADSAVAAKPAENPDGAVGLRGRRGLARYARIRNRLPPSLHLCARLSRRRRRAVALGGRCRFAECTK